ncbi:glycoside hydrolase family 9 protein [Synechococcus sp. PCC 7336]|uniref:glycoside hydrolase family 9 protein n=1 Tax=Synechococcus sp. PCC 7336 TaxID=195250 RepID=UPI00034A8D41|nr:glycoside hydrolase family 9 protein [Synechococcus sp. PCC 7336]
MANIDAKLTIIGDWKNTFTAELTVANLDSIDYTDWSFSFRAPYELVNIWNGAEIVSVTQEGGEYVYVVQGLGDETTLAANGQINFRFKANGQPSLPTDTNLAIDSTDAIELGFAATQAWNSGYNAKISLSNTGSEPVEQWELTFTTTSRITKIWSAEILSETVANGIYTYVVGNAPDWNDSIAPGDPATFGFTAEGAPVEPISYDVGVSDSTIAASGTDYGALDTPFGATDYSTALGLSMSFYYAQRSGDLPDDNPIAWRGDSALDDGSDVGLDLSGGWYDAGDHVKFHFPAAFTTTVLAWGALEFEAGYSQSGANDELLDHLAWSTDYLLRTVVLDGQGDVAWIAGQVGDGNIDHAYWGAPETLTTERPTYVIDRQNPGSDLAGEMAASLAASSIAFRQAGNIAYADRLLETAIAVYEFAETYLGRYSDSIPDAAQFYNSFSGYRDELAWGATWLYEATGDSSYLAKAEGYYQPPSLYFAWDNKTAGTAQLLYQITGSDRYRQGIDSYLNQWIFDLPRTPGTATNAGLAWLDGFGSNRYAANAAFLATVHASTLDDLDIQANRVGDLVEFASDQIDYVLGVNPDNQSFVVGFGENDPTNVHHRAASGTTDVNDPSPNLYDINGGLVGGPDVNGNYSDVRSNFVQNEVALDYNAGFSGALAGLHEYVAFGNDFAPDTASSSIQSDSLLGLATA